MEHRDSGANPTGWSSADTGGDPGQRGRWGTANKVLYLMWDDGSYGEQGYYIEGQPPRQSMLLQPSGSKKKLWSQVQ